MAGSGAAQAADRPFVVAAHGGSGASLLAALLRAPQCVAASLPAGASAVLTARTTGDGMDAVLAAAAALPPGTSLAAVVLSGDAPLPPPPRVRAGLRLLDPAVPVVVLPYVPAWRYGPASPATATTAWRRAAQHLTTALHPSTAAQAQAPPEAEPAPEPPAPHPCGPEPTDPGSTPLPLTEGAPA